MAKDIYDIEVETLDGVAQKLSDYRGQVLLVVNTASQCGFTPQYQGLETLYERFSGDGLAVLGFPCNQFGKQEPGDAEEIRSFCDTRFGVTFPLFAKIDVNGAKEHPLYGLLKDAKPGVLGTRNIKWNFTKFLVGRSGEILGRYGSRTKPEQLENDIRKALESK